MQTRGHVRYDKFGLRGARLLSLRLMLISVPLGQGDVGISVCRVG